jgi:hypothetical protein
MTLPYLNAILALPSLKFVLIIQTLSKLVGFFFAR